MANDIIYRPGGTAEFARFASNLGVGCDHRCRYCYGPTSLHKTQEVYHAAHRDKEDYIKKLIACTGRLFAAGEKEDQVLLEYAGDIYHGGDTSLAREAIKVLHDRGWGVCVLTKGGTRALRDIDLYDPKKDCFACSISTFDEDEIAEWEPDAPPPADRLSALKEFHKRGIYTWVSLEPVISPATSLDVIERTHRWVDHYKTGLMNGYRVPPPEGYENLDWQDYVDRFIAACEQANRTWYLKHTLSGYMPEGKTQDKDAPMHL